MSSFSNKRKSPITITVTEEEDLPVHDIAGIVEKYFVLHDTIQFNFLGYTKLGDVYRAIYEALKSTTRINFHHSMNDRHNLNWRKFIEIKKKTSEHLPILTELSSENIYLPPILIEISDNSKMIIKSFEISSEDKNITKHTQQLMLVIKEIVMQLYGDYLNSIRPLTEGEHDNNLVIIPKIYYVQRLENTIFVCMEYVSQNNDVLTFDKWDPIIKSVFSWFEDNKLYHHDTAPRNIFLTGTQEDPRLAVIDFGEAYFKYSNMDSKNQTQPQPSGYFKDQDDTTFTNWIEARNESPKQHEIYGGIKRKKLIRKKTKKRRGKKSKKNISTTRRKK